MEVLVLSFKDFRALCDNNRVYYFEGPYFFDFHFISKGVIVKSRIIKDGIDKYERFFSDRMFYGAIRLLFNVKNPSKDILAEVEEGAVIPVDLLEFQADETENTDIQKEGAHDEDWPY